MLIHSARHITYLGRTLKINSPSEFPNDSTILILSKSMTLPFSVKEKTRVSTEEIAKMTGLRKYLKFSEKTSVKVGSFEMKMADIAPDKSRFNFFINGDCYGPVSGTKRVCFYLDSRPFAMESNGELCDRGNIPFFDCDLRTAPKIVNQIKNSRRIPNGFAIKEALIEPSGTCSKNRD